MARLIILAYRLIPARIRHVWSFGSSTSHLALADPSWASIWRYGVHPALRMMSDRTYSSWFADEAHAAGWYDEWAGS